MSVKTGDVRGAGTDANAYIKIFGKEGDTGQIALKQSENTRNKFERGRVDQFVVEAMDIGEVFLYIFCCSLRTANLAVYIHDLSFFEPNLKGFI